DVPAPGGGALPTPRPAEPARTTYRPPADGRLTKPQVEAYLGVLEKMKLERARKPGGGLLAPGDPLDLESPDVTVARGRGLNVAEYLWVRERVLEAEAAALSEHLMAAHLAMLERTLAELKARRAAAPDDGSRKLLGEQLANFEAEANRTRRESREKEPENVRANMKTIVPYLARLEAGGDVLDQPLPRVAPPARSPSAPPAR
ncbi:MAG TPA: hypothetical protein PLB02_05055, partial [Thermoanaerobaculia bacterium]|nr:hypothetical protein [Thermoanaerobaculia bacterium]